MMPSRISRLFVGKPNVVTVTFYIYRENFSFIILAHFSFGQTEIVFFDSRIFAFAPFVKGGGSPQFYSTLSAFPLKIYNA